MSVGRLNRWTCHKLECLAEFIDIYARSLKNGGCYLEFFAGPGRDKCKHTDCHSNHIEPIALMIAEGFSRYILVAQDPGIRDTLASVLQAHETNPAVSIITGNSSREATMRQVFDLIPRSTASFALIDPSGYASLRWSLIKKLANHGADWAGRKMDLLIIFPLEMSLLRNLSRRECERSMTRFFGTDAWRSVRERQAAGNASTEKIRRELVDLYKQGLKELGYSHVEDAAPARFSNPPYYHVVWASDRSSRIKELKEVWGRDRYLSCEMFHQPALSSGTIPGPGGPPSDNTSLPTAWKR